MMTQKQNPTAKMILSTIMVILLATSMIVFVILPAVKKIQMLRMDIQSTEQTSEDQYKKIKLLKKSISELDTIREKVKPLEQTVINKDEAIKLIQDLENLAQEKNVAQTLNIQDGPNKNFILNFSVRGSFYDCLQYLYALEHLSFYIVIDSISWTKIDEQNVSLAFSASVFTK